MSAHTEAVEAAARALCNDDRQQAGWQEVTDEEWPEVGGGSAYSRQSQVTITAYLRHMREAGFVVTRVPDAEPEREWIGGRMSAREASAQELGREEGHNACRAATLANAVGVGE